MLHWDNTTVLVTGGGGSIATQVIKDLIATKNIKTIRVLDTNENALFKLKRSLHSPQHIRLLLGDVRDRERVKMALVDVDIVIHCAAIKNVEVSEYNAPETCRVNIDGTINLIECAMEAEVKQFLFVSSDKAVDNSTLYGATKFVGEKLVMWASKISLTTMFAAVRFGNVIESRGNVFDVWRTNVLLNQPLTVTHPDMIRYFWHVKEASAFIIDRIENMSNMCIYIPKMRKRFLKDVVKEFVEDNSLKDPELDFVGLRPGEKLDEDLFGKYERPIEMQHYWVVKG